MSLYIIFESVDQTEITKKDFNTISCCSSIKVVGIYKNKSEAIIMRNYLEYQQMKEFDLQTPIDNVFIIYEYEKNKEEEVEEEAGKWTDIDIENAPLDFKLDMTKDLKPNNWIYDKFRDNEIKVRNDQELAIENRKKRLDKIQDAMDYLRDKYCNLLINQLDKIKEQSVLVLNVHKQVVENNKLARKNSDPNREHYNEELKEKEQVLKSELGKMRRSVALLKNKCVKEMEYKMENSCDVVKGDLYNKGVVFNVYLGRFDHPSSLTIF